MGTDFPYVATTDHGEAPSGYSGEANPRAGRIRSRVPENARYNLETVPVVQLQFALCRTGE